MKILMTGGSSLIGEAILKNKEHQIVAPTSKNLDLSSAESIDRFDLSGFDCLIMVAGAGSRHGKKWGFQDDIVNFDYISKTIDVNCRGNSMLLKKWLSHNPKGHVITIGSISITEMQTKHAIYAASKVYLDRLIDLLSTIYPDTKFSKINPASVASRLRPYTSDLISPDQVADCVWTAIKNNIRRIDILDNTG